METMAPASPYTARVLPPEDWDRLPEDITQAIDPSGAIVVVVEGIDGGIVGHWVAMNTVHLEGLVVAPEARGNPVVARQLLVTMVSALKALGVRSALTIAQDDLVRTLAAKAGFRDIPGTLHRLDL